MAHCECLENCIFFNNKMKNMPLQSELFKSKYCKGEFEKCARYMVFKALGSEHVPENLFPIQQEKAKKIIADA